MQPVGVVKVSRVFELKSHLLGLFEDAGFPLAIALVPADAPILGGALGPASPGSRL